MRNPRHVTKASWRRAAAARNRAFDAMMATFKTERFDAGLYDKLRIAYEARTLTERKHFKSHLASLGWDADNNKWIS